jgi:predicted permease
MDGNSNFDAVFVEDHPSTEGKLPPVRRFKYASPGFFHAIGNPLLAGRDYTWTDIYNKTPAAVVTESFAREYWGSPVAAVGKRVRENLTAPWREIIGVVGNERDNGVDHPAPVTVYWPAMARDFWGQKTMVRRTVTYAVRSSRTGSQSFLNEIRQAVWSVNPDLPLAGVRTLQETYSKSMARTSFALVMLAIAGAMALLLGVIGIYGVISYSVSQRTREIGIRMALGAQRTALTRMFVRHGLRLAGIGLVFGLAASFALTRGMSSLLFGISSADPVTYLGVSAGLALAAALASYLPSRRASAVDPVEALRAE